MENLREPCASNTPERLLKQSEICSTLAISPAKFFKLVSDGVLPKPHKIGRAARWKASDIQAFVQACEPCNATSEAINVQAA